MWTHAGKLFDIKSVYKFGNTNSSGTPNTLNI